MTDAVQAEAKPLAEYDDFAKLDIRVGRVVEVQPFPRARNPSYKVAVDLGDLGIRYGYQRFMPAVMLAVVVVLIVLVQLVQSIGERIAVRLDKRAPGNRR